MRITGTSTARAAYYDRNATNANQGYTAQGVGPHIATTRFTYTVPAGRKAFVAGATALIFRDTAATGVGKTQAVVIVSDGTANPVVTKANIYNIAIGTSDRGNLGNAAYLASGANLLGTSQDASTGGANSFDIMATVLEFDA